MNFKSEDISSLLRHSSEDKYNAFLDTLIVENPNSLHDVLNSHLTLLFQNLTYFKPHKFKKIIQIILNRGGDPMLRNVYGETLACKALQYPDVEVVKMFLDHLKDINASLNSYGKRAIHVIVQNQDKSFLPIVLSYNPNLDIQDERCLTALHLAVLQRNYPKTKILVDAGANVDIADELGNTPILCILGNALGDESITLLLLDVANVRWRNHVGDTSLHLIMRLYKPYVRQCLQILLDKGADPSESNIFGVTPLHCIVRSKSSFPRCYSLEILKKLIEHGASISTRDALGNSILHLNAMGDDWFEPFPDFMLVLLKHGAEPNLVNQMNKTVIDIYKVKSPLQGLHLIRHLVLKSFENKFQFSPRLLSSIESHKKFAKFFNIYTAVLSYFECTSFYSTKSFTLFDVLTATSTEVLVRYVKNKDFRKMMATFNVDIYTAYGHDLKKKFKQGLKRYEAEMKAIQYFSNGGLMNFDCMEHIVQFLPTEELMRIVNS